MTDVDTAWPNGAAPPPGPFTGPGGDGGSHVDGTSVALSALAIVGLLIAIFALWISRCDLSVIDRLVDSLPGALIRPAVAPAIGGAS